MFEKYIPLDKSWAIRCICLDIFYGQNVESLPYNESLSDDVKHALNAAKDWKSKSEIYIGESATLFRFLKFLNWKTNANKTFKISGTLKNRKICDDPSIIKLSLDELLKLDNNTSQWASAAYLFGQRDLPKDSPFKLQVTRNAYKHWLEQRHKGERWIPILDETIANQVNLFLKLRNNIRPEWFPTQSEDYCFARTFNYISADEGLKLWPSLCNHESNRIIEMEKSLDVFKSTGNIYSTDHRVIQALVLYAHVNKLTFNCFNPQCVKKSWPEFGQFLVAYQKSLTFE